MLFAVGTAFPSSDPAPARRPAGALADVEALLDGGGHLADVLAAKDRFCCG